MLPVIDMASLFGRDDARGRERIAGEIHEACRRTGFFYVRSHGIDEDLISRLRAASNAFFALPEEEKLQIGMSRGGRAWRGYFPIGGELTSGKPDLKEGIYFGAELGPDDPRVHAGLPMHGANLFPPQVPDLRDAVLGYLSAAEKTAHAVMEGIALSLGLRADYFQAQYTRDPTILFRIFHYPNAGDSFDGWSVGEHTDYGLLTLLWQDETGGLEVKASEGWITAPPIPGTLVCNIGDMLDRLTGGYYRSTPHRAKNVSGKDRLSFPFFFDPAFDAEIISLPEHARAIVDDRNSRWDRESVHDLTGTYGRYLLSRVARVFPDLSQTVMK
jgi:isopenicillin N synthase-like dioxygenase